MIENPVSPKWIWGLASVWLIHHVSLWILTVASRDLTWSQALNQWDAGWYSMMATDGYAHRATHAFYPLYPLLLRIGMLLTFGAIPPAILGSLISTGIFFGFVGVCTALLKNQATLKTLSPLNLLPHSRWAWFFLFYSPASYVFHSNHTESLFLLISMLALWSAGLGRWKSASIFAGLAALTKNHGVLVAVAVAWMSAERNPGQRTSTFIKAGLLSALIFALHPLQQGLLIGDPLSFIKIQSAWTHSSNLSEYFSTFWFGNPWQNTNLGSIYRHAVVGLMILAAFWNLKSSRPVGALIAGYVLLLPLQGEFINAFRFSAVLVPIWVVWGHRVAQMPRLAQITIAVLFLYLNHLTTHGYLLGKWAY